MAKRPAPKATPAPTGTPAPELAAWLRHQAEAADAGTLQAFAGVALRSDVSDAMTCVHDAPSRRLELAGTVTLLGQMLLTTEANERMASLARRPDAAGLAAS